MFLATLCLGFLRYSLRSLRPSPQLSSVLSKPSLESPLRVHSHQCGLFIYHESQNSSSLYLSSSSKVTSTFLVICYSSNLPLVSISFLVCLGSYHKILGGRVLINSRNLLLIILESEKSKSK